MGNNDIYIGGKCPRELKVAAEELAKKSKLPLAGWLRSEIMGVGDEDVGLLEAVKDEGDYDDDIRARGDDEVKAKLVELAEQTGKSEAGVIRAIMVLATKVENDETK